MDRDVILAKLESLHRCIRRLEEKRPPTAAELAEDVDCQDILAVNLARAVQISVDIAAHLIAEEGGPAPRTMSETFEILGRMGLIGPEVAARLQRAVGFRNLAVHQYDRIDWHRVHDMLRDGLPDFRAFATAILARMPRMKDEG